LLFLSHLNNAKDLKVEDFKEIVQYLFTFIEKEKQSENLLTLLCTRFKATTDPQQWRNLAFCLTLLKYQNEKMAAKLKELANNFIEAIHDPEVSQYFVDISAKVREGRRKNERALTKKSFHINRSKRPNPMAKKRKISFNNFKRPSRPRRMGRRSFLSLLLNERDPPPSLPPNPRKVQRENE